MTLSPAAQALDAWCDAERGRAAALAAALSVTPTTVHNWRRGAIVPRSEGPDNRAAIEAHTGGAVPASGWDVDYVSANAAATPMDAAALGPSEAA